MTRTEMTTDPIATPEGMRPLLTIHLPISLELNGKICMAVAREYGKKLPKFISNGGPTAVIFVPLKPEDVFGK